MNIESICRAIDQLAKLAEGWREESAISTIERDIALDRIKPLYEALRFGDIEQSSCVKPQEEEVVEETMESDTNVDLDVLTFSAAVAAAAKQNIEEVSASASDPEVEVELIFEDSEDEKILEDGDEEEEPEIEVDLLFDEENEESDEIEEEESEEEVEENSSENDTVNIENNISHEEQNVDFERVAPQSCRDILLSLYNDNNDDESQPEVENIPTQPMELDIEDVLDIADDEEYKKSEKYEKSEVSEEPEQVETTIVEVLDFEDEEDAHEALDIVEEVEDDEKSHEQVFNINDYAPELEDITIESVAEVTPQESSYMFQAEESESKGSEESMGDIMGRIIGGDMELETVGERLAAQNGNTIFGEITSSLPLFDLEKDVNFNERYLLAQDLFGGDMEACNKLLFDLNNIDNFDDCMVYIVERHPSWVPEDEAVKLILSLLERRYPIE